MISWLVVTSVSISQMRDQCRGSSDAHCLRTHGPTPSILWRWSTTMMYWRFRLLHNLWVTYGTQVWQLEWWKETNLFKVLLSTKEDEFHNLCLCPQQAHILCVCAHMRKCIPRPMQIKLHVGLFFPLSVFVRVMHVRTHAIAFFMIPWARVYRCTPRAPPSLMWPRWVWKGNPRTRDPQCRSHLRPLMMGQRVSRPNRGRLSLAHTRTRAQWPFIVVSADLQPVHLPLLAAALMHSCYDGGWMGVMQRWRLCKLFSPSLISLLLFPNCYLSLNATVSPQNSNHIHHVLGSTDQ